MNLIKAVKNFQYVQALYKFFKSYARKLRILVLLGWTLKDMNSSKESKHPQAEIMVVFAKPHIRLTKGALPLPLKTTLRIDCCKNLRNSSEHMQAGAFKE